MHRDDFQLRSIELHEAVTYSFGRGAKTPPKRKCRRDFLFPSEREIRIRKPASVGQESADARSIDRAPVWDGPFGTVVSYDAKWNVTLSDRAFGE